MTREELQKTLDALKEALKSEVWHSSGLAESYLYGLENAIGWLEYQIERLNYPD